MTDLPAASTTAFNQDQYLDPESAADLIGLSASYMRKLRLTGSGPRYAKLGARAVRYRVGDLLAWAQSKTVKSTSDQAA